MCLSDFKQGHPLLFFFSFRLKNIGRMGTERTETGLSALPLHILEIIENNLSLKEKQNFSNVNYSLYQKIKSPHLLDLVQSSKKIDLK